MKIVVVGSGIAALALIHKLERVYPASNIICVRGDKFITPCTYKTTSVVSLRETKNDLSALGDLIVKSYEEFLAFNSQFSPSGVEKTIEEQWWNKTHKKHEVYKKRFGSLPCLAQSSFIQPKKELIGVQYDAFVIDIHAFIPWFYQELKTTFVDAIVTKIEDQTCFLSNQTTIQFDKLIDCTGYLPKIQYHSDIWEQYLSKTQVVSGTYLEYFKMNLGSKSFSMAFHDDHIIYRQESQTLLIGTLNEKNSIVAPKQGIFEILHELQNNFHLKLDGSPEIHTGVRLKGAKRMPFWGPIKPNIFAINGLYKNGFSFAFLAASDVAKQLVNH